MRLTRTARVCLVAAVVAVLAACSPAVSSSEGDSSAPAGDSAPGADATTVGVIAVGPKDDFGYNQAVYQGVEALRDQFPDLDVLEAYNIPEDDTAATTMESMIAQGATIIFATSYGHLDAAKQVAAEHPEVVVVHQGGTMSAPLNNFGTYFGTVYEPVFLAGIAAGKATKSNKLGFVYAFPIPQTIANINAFELGAQKVNPDAQTFVVNTSNWCDPAKQAEAAKSLFAQGVDVITQHQDCTATITKAAEEEGKMVVGYHADASALAPDGWVTGSEWDWGAMYNDIVDTALAGTFTGSKYNANYRAGFKDGTNPFEQSKFGAMVEADTQATIASEKERISTTGSPFDGPVTAQDGTVMFAEGEVIDYATVEAKNTKFVKGVVGEIPSN